MGETKVDLEICNDVCVFLIFVLFFELLCERRVLFLKFYTLYNCLTKKICWTDLTRLP